MRNDYNLKSMTYCMTFNTEVSVIGFAQIVSLQVVFTNQMTQVGVYFASSENLFTVLTLILPFETMHLHCGECRSRSPCTYLQSDLALHSLQLYHLLMSTKLHPMPF